MTEIRRNEKDQTNDWNSNDSEKVAINCQKIKHETSRAWYVSRKIVNKLPII